MGGRVAGEENEKYLAAAECLDLARAAQDEQKRVILLTLAQKWLELADPHSEESTFLSALEAFNNWQMKKR